MFFVVLLVAFAVAKLPRSRYNEDLANCPRDRNEAIDCILKYGDANHDRLIDSREIRILKDGVLYWYENWYDQLHPNDEIMKKCDHDGDGLVSERDFDNSLDTCLCKCEGVIDLMSRICDRAAANNYKPPRLAPLKEKPKSP